LTPYESKKTIKRLEKITRENGKAYAKQVYAEIDGTWKRLDRI
jgi:hypothetical protein